MTMYVVGLTGGIGSGKTTIAAIFAELGAEIINADLLARNVVSPGTKALTSIAKRFGKEILRQDGSLDRRKLREVVFKNKGELKWLEKLIHPLIAELLIQNRAPHLTTVDDNLVFKDYTSVSSEIFEPTPRTLWTHVYVPQELRASEMSPGKKPRPSNKPRTGNNKPRPGRTWDPKSERRLAPAVCGIF